LVFNKQGENMTKRENMTKPFSFWHFLCEEEGHLNFYSPKKELWFTCQRCGKNLEKVKEKI
jgi:hypothetical protein